MRPRPPLTGDITARTNFPRRMTVAYVLALVLLATFSVISHSILKIETKSHASYAEVASVSERQRTLSQRIALFGLSLVSAESGEVRSEFRRELGSLLALMESSHQQLSRGEKLSLSPKVSEMYFRPPMELNQRIGAFIAAGRTLANAPDDELSIAHPALRQLTPLSTRLLTDIEVLVRQLQTESLAAVEELGRLQDLVLGASLLCLGLTALLIFHPMVRRIHNELEARAATEAQLVASEAQYRLVTDSVNDAIFALSDDLAIQFANQAAANLFEHESFSGETFPNLLSRESRDSFLTWWKECTVGEGTVRTIELTTKRKNGDDLFLEVLLGRTPQGGEVRYIVSARDTTERRLARKRESRYLAELERSNQELEQFAYIISHDLKAPLHQVSSYAQLLARRYKDKLNTDAKEFIDFMVDGANRMKVLINDLLNLSRVTTRPQPFRTVDVGQVVGEVLKDLGAYIEENNGKVVVGTLPTIEADPSQIRSLLQNLIQNAIKFRRPDAPPVVTVSSHTTYAPIPASLNEAPVEQIEIVVEDNGIGFEQERESDIYKVFQRLHVRDQYEGTGIGLAISKKIVERHSGTIRAESQPGVGTKMKVVLPFSQPKASTGSEESSEEEEHRMIH